MSDDVRALTLTHDDKEKIVRALNIAARIYERYARQKQRAEGTGMLLIEASRASGLATRIRLADDVSIQYSTKINAGSNAPKPTFATKPHLEFQRKNVKLLNGKCKCDANIFTRTGETNFCCNNCFITYTYADIVKICQPKPDNVESTSIPMPTPMPNPSPAVMADLTSGTTEIITIKP